jgi:hypothetical protein
MMRSPLVAMLAAALLTLTTAPATAQRAAARSAEPLPLQPDRIRPCRRVAGRHHPRRLERRGPVGPAPVTMP